MDTTDETNAMEERIEGPLGLDVVCPGSSPTIDIIAVHGLGANPKWAWVRKVEVKATGEEKRVNWLTDNDLLPKMVPNARIITFNYESKWHVDAPKQRRSLCAEELLIALENKRTAEKIERRPMIFIGHSFGGIIIEEALIKANSRFPQIATATVGIIFLGTPLRGTAAAKWGEIIVSSVNQVGWRADDKILKNLHEDSESLADLLHEFTLWLFRMSVPVVCFFELHGTNYGKRFGMIGKMVGNMLKDLVVNETSACIDGHQKLSLPTDHLKINKYYGPDDPSFKKVYPEIWKMAQNAVKVVEQRFNPRTIVQDDLGVPKAHLECLRFLFLTNPHEDLAAIRRLKGERVKGTCEWLLVQEQYTAWLVEDGLQLLRLIGGPGIGKTMISTCLVDELEKRARISPTMTFAYYFCDNKNEKRNTATAIIRGLLLQLLRQHHVFFRYIQPEFNLRKDALFDNFDALWQILCKILGDFNEGQIYILIDALDECEESTRRALLFELGKLFTPTGTAGTANIKFVITSRPEIDDELPDIGKYIRVDSAKVNADLSDFINVKVDELPSRFPGALKKDIKEVLTKQAGGTFLWASLVLDGISKTKVISKVRAKLLELPSSLGQVYDRILKSIDDENKEDAILILQWVVIARRPLTTRELAMARALDFKKWKRNVLPQADALEELNYDYRCCEPLLYHDTKTDTINLVHQSVKDYLLGSAILKNGELSRYYIAADKTNLLIFQTCWRFLSMEEFNQGRTIIKRDEQNRLKPVSLPKEYYDSYDFLLYSSKEWQEHALAASPALVTDYEFKQDTLEKASTLRDSWLLRVAKEGHGAVLQQLLEKGAELEAKDYGDRTPLSWAAENGHEAVVRLLLEKGAELEAKDYYGRTPLLWAAEKGHEAVVRLLLEKGAELEAKDYGDRTPLSWAAKRGHEAVVKLLLEKGAQNYNNS